MCYNKEVSLISFILGTLINLFVLLYYKNNVKIRTICIIWQWVLMMQLSEYLIWKDQNCGNLNKVGTKLAMFFNLTQPIIVFIGLMLISYQSYTMKYIASLIILIYIVYMINNIKNNKEYICTKPSTKCTHLNLKWWNDFKKGGLIYCIALLGVILLLLRPLKLSLFVFFYILITLIISIIFYSCGQASMWCFMVVPFPLFLLIFAKLTAL